MNQIKTRAFWAALVCSLQVALVSAAPGDGFQGLGKDREHLTPELIALRSEQLEVSTNFYLLRFPQAAGAPARILEGSIWASIQRAAAQYDLDPMVLAGMIFIESYGDPLAKSPTGPAGIAQMTKSSAKEMGLVVNRKIRTGTRDVTRTRTVGKGKNRRTITETRQEPVYRIVDERYDADLAIMAMARRVSSRRAWLGGKLDFAVAEYHMGAGRMVKLLAAYFGRKIGAADMSATMSSASLSYSELFWTNTPYFRPQVYKQIEELTRVDFSPTYYFRVQQAVKLLNVYRRSPAEYGALVAGFRARPGESVASNPMWSFASEEDTARFALRRAKDVEAELGQRIVQLPTVAAQFGIRAGKKEEPLPAAERSTIGCLFFVARQLEALEGTKYKGLQTGTLVQALEGQTRSADRKLEPSADGVLRMHTLGWAFDVPRGPMSKDAVRDLTFVLNDLRFAGLLAFVEADKPKAFHVVRHPDYAASFEQIYWDAVAQPAPVKAIAGSVEQKDAPARAH
jgi:hypothetical protein